MMKKLILLLFSFNLISYSLIFAEPFPQSLRGTDFFIKQHKFIKKHKEKMLNTKEVDLSSNCREVIRDRVCVVAPTRKNEEPEERICNANSEKYAHYFESIYDKLSPIFQKMFCSVKYIFIEKKFYGTGYAGLLYDQQNNLDGAMIGVRKSALDNNLKFSQFASWKEQLSFGGNTQNYSLKQDLPSVLTKSKSDVNLFLYFLIVHEFGHLFDLANGLNNQDCKTSGHSTCSSKTGSWSAIGWKNLQDPKAKNDFKRRQDLCFYLCNNNPLPANSAISIYKDLAQTDFLSLYSSTNILEDFADSLAFFMIDQDLHAKYKVFASKDLVNNVIKKIHSKKFIRKYSYLEDFVSRADLIYP